MLPGEIVVVRHRGELLMGVLQNTGVQKIKVATGNNRMVESPPDRLLHRTGIAVADAAALEGFRSRVLQTVGQIDLGEVWRVLKEEPGSYTVAEIADLYWGASVTAEQYSAVLFALVEGNIYFTERDDGFVPLSDDRVEAALSRIAGQQSAQAEHEAFVNWMLNPSDTDRSWFNNRQKNWFAHIKDYAISGDEYEQRAQALSLLREIKGDTVGDLRRYGFSLLVAKGIWDEDAHLELIRADVPVDFEEETLREAEGFTPDESARLNLTHMAVFSIDDAATLDVDDALSVEATDEGLCIGVHIADVTAIVPIGTEVEKEARRRLMTLYLPERKIPMLPEVLSQGLCSLLESQRRCAVSFLYTLDRQLNVQDIRIVRSVIVNRFKLSYDAADQILSGDPHPLSEALQTLSQFVDVVYAQRVDRGAIELDRNEVAIRVDAEKHIEFRRRSGTSTAEHIVSEMMIYTNAAAARYFADHGIPAMYRRQAEPALKTVDNVVHESVKRYLLLRQLKPAELSLDPNPHATLGERLYCQITSPIRRYADLVLQRQLTAHLREEPIPYNRSALLDEISYQERTRELNRLLARREWYWLLRYVDEMPGLRIPCVVLEVRDREVVLELTEYGVRASMTPSGPLTAEDEIAVKAVQADAWTGMLKLTQIA